MGKVELVCAVLGEGSVISVKVERDAMVVTLKKRIFYEMQYNRRHHFHYSALTLYLAKKTESESESKTEEEATDTDEWLAADEYLQPFLRAGCSAGFVAMHPAWRLNDETYFGKDRELGEKKIHVLVKLPDHILMSKRESSAEVVAVMDPQVQSDMWKSIVRVSSGGACLGTALVVDRTATHVYLLTTLRMWINKAFNDYLSDAFQAEMKRYAKLYPEMKKKATRKRKSGVTDSCDAHKAPATSTTSTSSYSGATKLQIVIDQLDPDTGTMKEVTKVDMTSDICWRSSAVHDFAILEVPVPEDAQLVMRSMSMTLLPPFQCHVFGFPSAVHDRGPDRPYATVPAKVTGWREHQLVLPLVSDPGLSGNGVLCTTSGVVVGYLASKLYGIQGRKGDEQYHSFAFSLEEVPDDLPSLVSWFSSPHWA